MKKYLLVPVSEIPTLEKSGFKKTDSQNIGVLMVSDCHLYCTNNTVQEYVQKKFKRYARIKTLAEITADIPLIACIVEKEAALKSC